MKIKFVGFCINIVVHTEKTKKKISKSMKTAKCKIVLQLNNNGKILKQFKSIKEASKKTRINGGNISQTCNKKRFSAGGYIWKFKKQNSRDR